MSNGYGYGGSSSSSSSSSRRRTVITPQPTPETTPQSTPVENNVAAQGLVTIKRLNLYKEG